ncbi:hypothetical protein MTR67_030155 [Solanum verrucosum]|uniref:Uncharacterized protein n=1 Tax=Solanum verrucosum TaxID=315347 RepID=A0AAF0R9E6_SOLVR|nr:hypothetical protein MTR67_030155 [Solanum verrucosum]
MHDKLQALVAIIALVPVLKFRLSETKRPVACTALNFKWFGLGTSMLEVSSSKSLASESKGFAFWVELFAPGFSSAGYLSYVVCELLHRIGVFTLHKKPREEDIAICECKYDANIREASISIPFKAIKKSCHFCDVTRASTTMTSRDNIDALLSHFLISRKAILNVMLLFQILLVVLLWFLFFLIISQPEWRVKWPELVFSKIAFVICETVENNPQVDDIVL